MKLGNVNCKCVKVAVWFSLSMAIKSRLKSLLADVFGLASEVRQYESRITATSWNEKYKVFISEAMDGGVLKVKLDVDGCARGRWGTLFSSR